MTREQPMTPLQRQRKTRGEQRMTQMERQRESRRAKIAALEETPTRTSSQNALLSRLKVFEASDPAVIREREIRAMFRSK